MKIAVDAMGGDHAPKAIIDGAIEAARKSKGEYEVVLVGDEKVIQQELDHHHFFVKDLLLSIVHASQQIGMSEAPAMAMRKKPDSSIAVATKMHAEGKVDAVVSAGNTGAMLAAALFLLKRIDGVQRPAIGSFIPHESGVGFIIDVGTNVDCKPSHLLQFGLMGSIFVNHVMGIENPRVGLINIGEESSKGNERTQAAYQLLEDAPYNFIGNVEGRDVMRGRADVIVTDGFIGNIMLKFGESVARMIALSLKKKIGGNFRGHAGLFLIRPKFRKLLKIFDYQEYGGTPLLGVKGTCIIAHGSSTPRAIHRAIEEAVKTAQSGVALHIEKQIKQMKG